MKRLSTSDLGKILKWALVFVFALGLFLTPLCHYMLNIFYGRLFMPVEAMTIGVGLFGGAKGMEYYCLVGQIYVLGIVMLGMVYQLIGISANIENGRPFHKSTYLGLKRMAYFSLGLVTAYGIKFALFPDLPSLLLIFTFAVAGMISSVFSQLFKKALEYKEENDLTI